MIGQRRGGSEQFFIPYILKNVWLQPFLCEKHWIHRKNRSLYWINKHIIWSGVASQTAIPCGLLKCQPQNGVRGFLPGNSFFGFLHGRRWILVHSGVVYDDSAPPIWFRNATGFNGFKTGNWRCVYVNTYPFDKVDMSGGKMPKISSQLNVVFVVCTTLNCRDLEYFYFEGT